MWPSEQVLVNTNMETVTDLSNVLSLEFAALMTFVGLHYNGTKNPEN